MIPCFPAIADDIALSASTHGAHTTAQPPNTTPTAYTPTLPRITTFNDHTKYTLCPGKFPTHSGSHLKGQRLGTWPNVDHVNCCSISYAFLNNNLAKTAPNYYWHTWNSHFLSFHEFLCLLQNSYLLLPSRRNWSHQESM